MVAAAVIGGGAALGGAVIASNSAKSAAKTQAGAAKDAMSQEMAMYNQTREDQMPWLKEGQAALGKLGGLLGTSGNASDAGYGSLLNTFGASDFEKDPGYDFRLSEGQKALERSAAAKGGLLSGAAAKAANNYAQNTASDEYQNAYNRFNTNQTNIYNRLSGVAGTGQTTANSLATQSANQANNNSNLITGAGNAMASGQVASGNAWSTGLTSAGGSLNSALSNQKILELLKNQ